MQLRSIEVMRSPDYRGMVRLLGKVSYETGTVSEEDYWFEVPEQYADAMSRNGNPWLACLLPVAVTFGEPMRICAPVDSGLVRGVQEIMQVWRCWYPHLRPVEIQAETYPSDHMSHGKRTAAFMSGGVDSFFTVMRHQSPRDGLVHPFIDDLICLEGFDIPLTNHEAFAAMRDRLASVAGELGKILVEMRTNVRTTRFGDTNWGYVSHICALAGCALVLENRYKEVLIASSDDYAQLVPWGSHPVTDHLFSTGISRIVHDGAGFSRPEKLEALADCEVAQRALHVCWIEADDKNCGACCKCVRTMATLEIIGALDRFSTFERDSFTADEFKNVLLCSWHGPNYMSGIKKLALKRGRTDFARAIDYSIRRTLLARKWLPVLDQTGRIPAIGYFTDKVKWRLLKDGINR